MASTTVPKPDETGGDRRFASLLELLARNHRVDFCAVPSAPVPPDVIDRARILFGRIGVRFLALGWRSFSRALLLRRYDIGLFEFFWQAEHLLQPFRSKQPNALVIVDSVDVHYERELAGAALGLLDPCAASDTCSRELAIYRSADAVIAASVRDAAILERQGGINHIVVFPIVIDPRVRPKRERGPELLFVGGFIHPPNQDAIKWFVKDVWPHVRRDVPDATVTVVGSHMSSEIEMLGRVAGVNVAGHVPETAPYLDRAAVAIAPLRYGGGMKGKVVEAMAAGVPVLTTPIGIQGLPVRAGADVVIANDADEFARAAVMLLRDPVSAEQIGLAGQRVATELCDRAELVRHLNHLIRELIPGPSRRFEELSWAAGMPSRLWNVAARRLVARWHSGSRQHTGCSSASRRSDV